ncbi:MAG: O-antigen ligase family protein [Wenyingzhuangia sp.]|uniref:O-antigen ligase family protein n=1 Tax=Wenyingzhuangia sp. TaxID=1964193 RepID=UPI00321AD1C5
MKDLRFKFNLNFALHILCLVPFVLMFATPFVSYPGFVDVVLGPKLIWIGLTTTIFAFLFFLRNVILKPQYGCAVNEIDICVLLFFLILHINHLFTDISYISSKISISTTVVVCYVIFRLKLQAVSIEKYLFLLIPLFFVLAFVTSIMVLYQYVLLNEFDKGLGMTAAMGNSGAVASYLGMLVPWMLVFVNAAKTPILQYLCRVTLMLTLMAVFFTQARASWVAILLSSLFVLMVKYRREIKKMTSTNINIKPLFVTLFLILFILGSYALFHLKKDSTNGRVFIWKRTIELISDDPLTGVGFHKFGSMYPTYQASHLEHYPNDPNRFLANDINHPFNEYLYFLAELGLIGFIFFILLLTFVFLAYWHQRKQMSNVLLASYGGVLSFVVLSFFTYPFQIFSIQFLVFFFMVVIASSLGKNPFFIIPKQIIVWVSGALCVLMVLVSNTEFKRFKREIYGHQIDRSNQLFYWKTRYRMLENLYELNRTNGRFLSAYGIELTMHKEYEEAIKILQEATHYTKTADLYLHLGISFEERSDFDQAKAAYEMATSMVPHKFLPKYRLVYLYDKIGLKNEALYLAKRILVTPAKVHSKSVVKIKHEMRKYVKNM